MTAKQRAYDTIKRELLEGIIRPGERILDNEISARLMVSRTPVREALLALEREGLVRIVRRQGYFASEISLTQTIESYQLRLILEPIATAMAARRITSEEIDALRDLADVATDGTAESFARAVERNRAFHVRIAEASGNSQLAHVMADLMDSFTRLNYVQLGDAHTATSWRDEHLDIIAALERHDPTLATQTVRASFQRDHGLPLLRAQMDLAGVLEVVGPDVPARATREGHA